MNGRYFIFAAVLLAAQILANNFLSLPQFIIINILPLLVIALPPRIGTFWALILTFAVGFFTDFLSGGVLGLTLVALLPVAALRSVIYRLVLGSGAMERQEDLSIRRQGVFKVSVAIILSLLLFFAIYIWVNTGEARPFWTNMMTLGASTLASYIISIFAVRLLTS